MEKRLHEVLRGKKVLLVLDDLCEEDSNQLKKLKSMLTSLGNKVDVIVTTCNQAIAEKICTVEPYMLNPLDDDACWEIIKKSIPFENKDQELEMIGWEIARKCCGLPSAAQAYACQLDSTDPRKWIWVREKNIFDVNSASDLLSTFKFSYMSMLPELRQCFAYCAIFPSGHNIVKDELVHQWIVLHFIEPSERLSATQIAEEYITRLLDLSFLQSAKSEPASRKGYKGAAMFTMHDLVHDFARFCDKLTSLLHHRLVTDYRGELDEQYLYDLRALHCINCTNLVFNDGSFSSKRPLRVLELKESPVQKLPDSICQLRHLGYLKISDFTGLVTLPESFGDLTNLFYIDLSGCSRIVALPESFGDLINLSHVNLSRCNGLAELPEQLQKLRKLVHLNLSFWSCFEEIGKGLGGLTNLEHLNLSHPCCHLAQQRSHLQGLKDGLCKLTRLRYLNLSMCLNPILYYKAEEDSLKFIESCISGLSNLENLDLSHNTIPFYLPESLGGLNRLHILDLSGCIRLKNIPEMRTLEFINLRNCRGIESWHFVVRADDDAAYRSSNLVKLEEVDCKELQISCLEKVKSKEETRRIRLVEKQKLHKLKLSWTLNSLRSVEDSVLLGVLVPPPNLECLEVNGYSGTCLPECLGDLTSLQELKIICCKQINCLPDSIEKLTNLKNLCIVDCPELEKWCQEEGNKKMLTHITKKNYEERGSTSRPESEEDWRSIDDVEAA